MLPAPTSDELCDWLRVAGPPTATGTLLWTPGEQDVSVGWVSFGEPPLFVHLPAGVEVRFSYDGPRRWALDGPDGPLGRSDGRRAVACRGEQVEVGGELLLVPPPELLLLPDPPDEPDGEVVADELLGRACWRWTAQSEVRWVDDLTGCLLALRSAAGTLALTAFEPGARVDPPCRRRCGSRGVAAGSTPPSCGSSSPTSVRAPWGGRRWGRSRRHRTGRRGPTSTASTTVAGRGPSARSPR